jgi:uncharacterized protein (DUF4415 family)
MKRLTRVQGQDVAVSAEKGDEEIDLFEMLETRNGNGATRGMLRRPMKRPVTMRLDEDVLDWLKGFGPGYQTRANLLLRHAMMNGSDSESEGK